MENKNIATVKKIFAEYFKTEAENITPLIETGSYRSYYRISTKNISVLGVINSDLRENKAYLSFSKTFLKCGIKVPKIIHTKDNQEAYLVEDLGKCSLYDFAHNNFDTERTLSPEAIKIFEKSLKELIKIQSTTIDQLDTSLCYPRDSFDFQSMIWDLYYFKYYCLKLFRINFDEELLEKEMQDLAHKLNHVDKSGFLFRDFQSRNIIIKDNEPYFIDFQGGRKGAFYYDLASLLYDANIELKAKDREHLKRYYYSKLVINKPNLETFNLLFDLFASIRLMQALGAFGLRGVVEKKPNFIKCIPYAIASLNEIISKKNIKRSFPELNKCISELQESSFVKEIVNKEH